MKYWQVKERNKRLKERTASEKTKESIFNAYKILREKNDELNGKNSIQGQENMERLSHEPDRE